jgi:hypothetical protein
VLALVALALVVLIVGVNMGCAPKYFQRGDVAALLGLAISYAALLAWATLGDSDRRRAVGAVSSAGLAALFLSTVSIPVLAAPAAIVGAFRLPRSSDLRRGLIVALPGIVLLTLAVVFVGALGVTSAQATCP